MPREFELSTEITVDATPEEVWAAISTGPGIDSWFMGRTELEPGEGGAVRLDMGAYEMQSDITAWDPPHRLAHRTEVEPDGTFRAFEYIVEGRDQGSTVVRAVISGFLGADNWETEYNALSQDGPIYPYTLGQYLTHFLGRTGQPITGFGARVIDRETYWTRLDAASGCPHDVAVGDEVRLTPEGLAHDRRRRRLPVADPARRALGRRSLPVRPRPARHGRHRPPPVRRADVDQPEAERAWTTWLDRTFA